jgi:hypothetical protein
MKQAEKYRTCGREAYFGRWATRASHAKQFRQQTVGPPTAGPRHYLRCASCADFLKNCADFLKTTGGKHIHRTTKLLFQMTL